MTATAPQASLAELARWLRVEEGDEHDRLVLASPWQMLPADAPNRHIARIGGTLALFLVLMLFLQAALTASDMAWGLALLSLGVAIFLAWHLRGWFWRTVVDVDGQQLSLSHRGWGVPVAVALPLDDIQALAYRMRNGQLSGLILEHQGGRLALPYSGQRELDKLYCNLLRHLLQKRRPAIRFGQSDEAQPLRTDAPTEPNT
jgi:hypothetical protein